MRVLVAEDDRGLREVLVQGLEEAGYFVDAVAAGDEAIEQLRFYEYDVAVIDWRMPRVSGLEVVAWARRNNRPTAMLMLTARDTPSDRIEGLDAGRRRLPDQAVRLRRARRPDPGAAAATAQRRRSRDHTRAR